MARPIAPSFALRTYLRQCLFPRVTHHTPQPLRTFSCSCRRSRKGFLATYPPTSSSELDSFLSTLREKIFLPNHLQTIHRDLVMRESLHHFLQAEEPVIAPVRTVDALDQNKTSEEKFRLEPRIINADEKNLRAKAIRTVVSLLQTPEDFKILPALLRELRATRKVTQQFEVSKIIRRAADRGVYGFLLEMLGKGEDDGLAANTPESGREVMLLCLHRGIAGEWDEKETDRALKHATTALRILKTETHAPDGVKSSQAVKAENVGVALALAGIRATKFKNNTDEDGKVQAFTDEFLEYWPNSEKTALEQLESDLLSTSRIERQMQIANIALQKWAPAWTGVQLAQRVITDEKQKQGLKEIFDGNLKTTIERALDILKNVTLEKSEQHSRGPILYNALSKTL